jgi:hypothetical protein
MTATTRGSDEMAIKGQIPMSHGDVFPHGCFVVGEVQAMRDFDKSTRDTHVQAVDKDSGVLVWVVDVVDADPDARDRTVRVKITAPHQPVPPETTTDSPFRPVEFEGLTASPYVATTASGRGKLTWSFRASGMKAPMAAALAGNGKGG